MSEELLNYSSLARELGIHRQSVRDRKLPKPDYVTRSGERETKLWRRRTLQRAGILKGAPTER